MRRPFSQPAPKKAAKPARVGSPGFKRQFLQVFQEKHGGKTPQQYNQQFRGRQRRRAFNQAPIVPGSDITNRDLAQQTRAATQLQYGPQQQVIGQQLQQNAQVNTAIPQWYQQYQDLLGRLGQQSQAAYQNAVNNVGNLAFTQGNAAAQQSQAQLAQMQQDAALRGATVDPEAAQRAVNAQAVVNMDTGAQGQLLNLLGLSNGQYFRNQEGIAGQQQIQSLLQNASKRHQIQQDLEQLKADEGAFGTKYQADTKNTEQGNVLERFLYQTNAADKAADNQRAAKKDRVTARQNAAKLKTDKRNNRIDFESKHGVTPAQYQAMTPQQRAANDRVFKKQSTPPKPKTPTQDQPYKYGYTKKEWLALPLAKRQQITARNDKKTSSTSSKTGGKKGLTATQTGYITDLQNAVSWARRLQKQGKSLGQTRAVLGTGLSGKSSSGATLKIPSFDAWAVQAAVNVVYGGSLSQKDVTSLRTRGIPAAKTGYSFTTGPKTDNGPFTVKHKPGNRGGA